MNSPSGPNSHETANEGDDSYDTLLELEDLESLIEEAEEGGFTEDTLPAELRERLAGLGFASLEQARGRIRQAHAELDELDS